MYICLYLFIIIAQGPGRLGEVARASGALRARKLKKTEVGATEASARLPGHPGNLRNGPGGAPGILGRSPGAVEAKKRIMRVVRTQ